MGLSPLLLLRLQGTLRLRLDQLLAIFILSVAVHFGETFPNMLNLLPTDFVTSYYINLNVFIVFGVSIEYFDLGGILTWASF